MLDQFGNVVLSSQLADIGAYDGTPMLDATYSLTDKVSGESISEYVPLQLMDYEGKVTIKLDQITEIGSYELKLALASV